MVIFHGSTLLIVSSLTFPIALTTMLFFPWAMTPFPLYSVRNDFDFAVFLFVNITSFSSIPPAASMNYIDFISCA
jgi:hypothetical protein